MQKFLLSLIGGFLFFVPFLSEAKGTLQVTEERMSIGSIPKGALRVPFVTLQLQAGCEESVSVTSFSVSHSGKGKISDITQVYIGSDVMRLSRGRSLTEAKPTMVRLMRPLLLKACEKKTLTVLADISSEASAASEHLLKLTSIEAGDTTVTQKTMQSRTNPTTVRPKQIGTITASFLDLTSPLRFGNNRTLARIKLSAGNQSDHSILSIHLTNDGTARDLDLQDLVLTDRAGKKLSAEVSSLTDDKVRLEFNPPLTLQKNGEVLLHLKGDIHGKKRRTIRFILEEASDLEAVPLQQRNTRS